MRMIQGIITTWRRRRTLIMTVYLLEDCMRFLTGNEHLLLLELHDDLLCHLSQKTKQELIKKFLGVSLRRDTVIVTFVQRRCND